ncbi:kinase-like protein [Coccomyxa subellipsoidea C-169]|uniref:Kinase-like protein n=1 Tax=Coccomyxa subellipsoidea (strain C-169) TaxID=574566 RepID=I0YWX2_COCSC|nr:kinase-like protein [Coccomyxa subellipsoidea C-169]EIE22891.1 kinase-like protein [Coccomyxa subellipsoidea C-169]|eukprot:XP_005647435.1 kinase-like protein [Coccomyxa subellipsoidea C-169]
MPPVHVFTCGELRGSCVEGKGIAPVCPAPPPDTPAPNTSASNTSDMAALLRVKAAFANFDTSIRRRTALWDPGLPMCSSWQGVTCWPDGYVRTIDLSIPERAPPDVIPLTVGGDNTSFAHASVPHQLSGNVSQVLESAAGLARLTKLDLTNQNLQGYFPANISFPWLEELKLGTLPETWAAPGSFPSLRLLALDLNWRVTGPLPQTWGSSTGSFRKLEGLHLDHNLIQGSLPPSWGTNGGMASLHNISLTFNKLTGSIPPAWGNDTSGRRGFSALESLVLQPGNPGMCGSIPPGITVDQWLGGPNISQVDNYGPKICPGNPATSAASSAASSGVGTGVIVGIVVGAAALLNLEECPEHDSDSIIPPQPPRSYAPSSVSLISFTTPASNSGGDSWGASQSSGELELVSMAGHKDWELDLDALEVEMDEQGKEVELGHGAFGVVVKGTYRMAPVAIKRLKDQSPGQQRAFLNEMAILRACRGSRYIIPFVGASLLPGNTILAMDYMDNGNLWAALPRVGRNGQPIFQWHNRGKRVAHEIALGLHFLHELKVVHLDLKSSNVLLAADGTAKISDVGLSAQMDHSHISSMPVAGTWAWLAPEVILRGKITNKADMFSFGVVLWEIITLERPMWRGNLREIRVPEEAPQEIADLVFRCTARPEERPSAANCADIIKEHLIRDARSGDSYEPRSHPSGTTKAATDSGAYSGSTAPDSP